MTTDLHNPHDRFFKATFGRLEVAAECLQRYLPAEVAALLNWSTLRAAKEGYLDPQLAQHTTDLLYAVDLWTGEKAFVYLLFEHKSYVELRINLDLLRYRVRIWEQRLNDGHSGLLPVIIPVVFYHGVERWTAKRQFADTVASAAGLQRYVPTCEYHLVDLSAYPDGELCGAVILQVALLTFKYASRGELAERLPDILRLLRELAQGSTGLDFIRALLRYLGQVMDAHQMNPEMLRRIVTEALQDGGQQMATIAEYWVEEGRKEGLKKGREEGREEGREQTLAELLEELLAVRFGPLSEPVRERLAGAEADDLRCWFRCALTAASLEAVFAGGNE